MYLVVLLALSLPVLNRSTSSVALILFHAATVQCNGRLLLAGSIDFSLAA